MMAKLHSLGLILKASVWWVRGAFWKEPPDCRKWAMGGLGGGSSPGIRLGGILEVWPVCLSQDTYKGR